MAYDLACEVCDKRIEHKEEVVKIEVGNRNKGLHPRYTSFKEPAGDAVIHIECINIEHNQKYPEKTAAKIAERIDQSEVEQ